MRFTGCLRTFVHFQTFVRKEIFTRGVSKCMLFTYVHRVLIENGDIGRGRMLMLVRLGQLTLSKTKSK
jgi:hypothetical protein